MSSSVSIVIPTRNRGSLLLEAVGSALEARPEEIVLADGGSTDGSIEQAAALSSGISLVRGRFPNAAATRNAGAAAASGDYIGFLDSDDVMLPAKISCLRAVLDREPDVGLVHGRTIVVDERGEPDGAGTLVQERAYRKAEALGTSYDALARFCAMFTSATLIRRSAFESVGGYDETLDVYEDWDLYLRLSLDWRLVYENCPTAKYRAWPGNVAWHLTAAGVIRVAEKHLAELPPLPPGTSRRARYNFLRRVAGSHHVLVHPAATRRATLAALRTRPSAALVDSEVLGLTLRSFVPAAILHRRRPPLRSG